MDIPKLKHLFNARAHLGREANQWNSKMFPYIHLEKNGIHFLDLVQTKKSLRKAAEFSYKEAKKKKIFLFVGTKPYIASLIAKEAINCNSYYINYRWFGGLLTNWDTVKTQVDDLKNLEHLIKTGRLTHVSENEAEQLEKQLERLNKYFEGIKSLPRLPDVIVIIDQLYELTAIKEAQTLKIPIIATLNTDCNPDGIEKPIPANNTNITTIKIILKTLGNYIKNGHTAS